MEAVICRDKRHFHLKRKSTKRTSAGLQASTDMECSLILNFQHDADTEDILFPAKIFYDLYYPLLYMGQVLPAISLSFEENVKIT